MKFSLIIPCYNEAENIPLLLNRCKEILSLSNVEVILVNNGSTDNSLEVLLNLMPQYPQCRSINVKVNQGYGFGILAGLKIAKGEILAWTHADMQADPQDVLSGMELFEQFGFNIFVKGRRCGRPLVDAFFTFGMSCFETILLKKPMWDINSQPTMFSRQFFETWIEPPNDFSLDLYAYYHAKLQHIDVYRFPVKFSKRAYGVSHWNVNWAAKLKFIRRTIDFSLQLKNNLKK